MAIAFEFDPRGRSTADKDSSNKENTQAAADLRSFLSNRKFEAYFAKLPPIGAHSTNDNPKQQTEPPQHSAASTASAPKKSFLDTFRTKVAIAVVALGTLVASIYTSKKLQQADRNAAEGGSKAVPVEVTRSSDRNAPPHSVVKGSAVATNSATNAVATNSPAASKIQSAPMKVLGPVVPVAPVDPFAFLSQAFNFLNGPQTPAVRPPLAPPKAPQTATTSAKSSEKPTTPATPATPAASATATNKVAAVTGATATPAAAVSTPTANSKEVAPNPFVNLTTKDLGDLLSHYSSKAHQELKLTSQSEAGWERATELAKTDGIDLGRAATEYRARLAAEGKATAETPPAHAKSNPFDSMSTADLSALVSKYGTLAHQELKLTAQSKEGWARACELAKKDNIDLDQASEVLKARLKAAEVPAAANAPAAKAEANPYEQMSQAELQKLLSTYGSRAHQELKLATQTKEGWDHAEKLAAADGVDLAAASAVYKARLETTQPQASNDASLRVAMNIEKMSAPELNTLLQGYRTRAIQELGAKQESQETWNKAAELAAKDGVQLDQLIDRVNERAKTQSTPTKPAAKVTSPRRGVNHKAVLNTPGRSSAKQVVETQPATPAPTTQSAFATVSTAQLEATLVDYSNRGKAAVQAEKGAAYEVPVQEAMRAGAQLAAQDGVSLIDVYNEYMSRTDRGAAQSGSQSQSNAAPAQAPAAAVAAPGTDEFVAANLTKKPRSVEKMIRSQEPITSTSAVTEMSVLGGSHRGKRTQVLMETGADGETRVVGMTRDRRLLGFIPLPRKITTAPGVSKQEYQAKLANYVAAAQEFSRRAGFGAPVNATQTVQVTPAKFAPRNSLFAKRGSEALAGRNG
jgi:hypothetical protein